MSIDPEQRKRRSYELRRSILDYGMGVMILGFGVFLLIAHHFGFTFTIEPYPRYCLAALFMIYGAWRIYRGYKKNYYSD
jgi:hypothetical protein